MVVPMRANTVVIEPLGIVGINPASTLAIGGAAIIRVDINTRLIRITSSINAFSTTLCLPLYKRIALHTAINGVHICALTPGKIPTSPILAPLRFPASYAALPTPIALITKKLASALR